MDPLDTHLRCARRAQRVAPAQGGVSLPASVASAGYFGNLLRADRSRAVLTLPAYGTVDRRRLWRRYLTNMTISAMRALANRTSTAVRNPRLRLWGQATR